MLLRRSSATLTTLLHLRPFSPAAAAVLPAEDPVDPQSAPLEYLPGFPRPDPKHSETILVVPRANSGKNIAARSGRRGGCGASCSSRRSGRRAGTSTSSPCRRSRSASSSTTLAAPSSSPGSLTSRPAPTSAALNSLRRSASCFARSLLDYHPKDWYLCPADIIPPYIDVVLSELDVGQKILLQDIKVHPALQLLHPSDQRAQEQKKSN